MKTLKSILSEAYSNCTVFSEGGAAGHMAHVWELTDVTFGEIKDIFKQLFSGQLEVSEKCLAPDAKLLLEQHGEKTIAEVVENKLYDKVLSYDKNKNEIEYKQILDFSKNTDTNNWLKITLENGNQLICTPNHRIYNADIDKDAKAEDLRIGDNLIVSCLQHTSKIVSIQPYCNIMSRYDITVEDFHHYFANGILVHNTDGQNLTVTFKDGEIKAARNKATLKEPMSIEQVAEKYASEDRATIREAFVESMRDVEAAVKSMSKEEIKDIFNDGQNFISLEIIFPPTKNVVDYGGRCLVQFHGLAKYDEKFNKIGEDKELAKKLYKVLKSHDALNQKTFEIAGPAVLKIKNAKSAEDAEKEIIADLDNLMNSVDADDDTTVEQFVAKHYGMKIKEAAEATGVSVNDEAVNAIVDRLNPLSSKQKPKKQEIQKLLAGNNSDATKTKQFFAEIEAAFDDDFSAILLPLETIIVKGGAMLIENLTGFVSADKSESAKKLANELDASLKEMDEKSKSGEVSENKLRIMLKNLKKLDEFGKTPTGIEGIVFTWKGRLAKLTANFGAINQLLGLFKYDRG